MPKRLKYQHIPVGAQVRAFDAVPKPNLEDRYIDGVVVDHHDVEHDGYKALVVEVTDDRTFSPRHSRRGERVYVPMHTREDESDGIWAEIGTNRVLVLG